jgi:hypothetical protein
MYYARSKGAYIGFSLDGAILLSRWTTNKSFYGEKVKVKDVLDGKVLVPPSKAPMVDRFNTTLADFEAGRVTTRIEGRSTASDPIIRKKSSLEEAESETRMTKQEQDALLLDFQDLGVTGKELLRSSLESGNQSVVFISDHVVNENDPGKLISTTKDTRTNDEDRRSVQGIWHNWSTQSRLGNNCRGDSGRWAGRSTY